MKKPKSILLVMLLLTTNFISGQTSQTSLQLVCPSGENFKNQYYQLDWSLGEIFSETFINPNNTITQGFHQGNYIVTAIDQIGNLEFAISVFPVPANDFIVLKIDLEDYRNIHFELIDMKGKILQNKKITSNTHQINLSGMAAGIYCLRVQSDQTAIKTFKIVKSH